MKQPVYFICDPTRKPRFVLETRIWQNDNYSLVAEKRPATSVATTHLSQMTKSYEYLSKLKKFNTFINVVPAEKNGTSLNFRFIDGNSVERLLLEAILSGDKNGVKEIIDHLIEIIGGLPSKKCNPADNPDYNKVFGKSYGVKADCSEIGLIDINFDNIISDSSNNWHLIDYEWAFNFPVSKHFLIQRAIWYSIARHQETFKYHAERLGCLSLAKGRFFVPAIIFNSYKEYFAGIDHLQDAEQSFQKYIMQPGYIPKPKLEYYDDLSDHMDIIPPAKESDVPLVGIDSTIRNRELKSNKKLRQELQQQIDNERKKKAELEKQLSDITSSRTYRLANKIASAKRKLSR